MMVEASSSAVRTLWTRLKAPSRLVVVRVTIMVALAALALATPSFLSAPSLTTLLTTISFIGCLAIAMTFITIGGNVMSFALGASAAVSAMVFVAVLNTAGYAAGVAAAVIAGAVITGLQGCLIGFLRANPIIVSIAASVLIYGVAQRVTNNETVHISETLIQLLPKGKLFGAPIEFIVFLGLTAFGQAVLSFTTFGRNLFYVGSGFRAAEAVGLPTVRTTIVAYVWAGVFAGMTGVLLASRYNQANMEFALRYDYDAIAAVLVGGTAIQGGSGSMLRTFGGVAAVSTIQIVLLLHGFREEWRLFITGLIVLAVVLLYSKRQRQ